MGLFTPKHSALLGAVPRSLELQSVTEQGIQNVADLGLRHTR